MCFDRPCALTDHMLCFEKLHVFDKLSLSSISNTDLHNYRENDISLGQFVRELSGKRQSSGS